MKKIALLPETAPEQRVMLLGVTWQQYESLLETLGDYPKLRLIYLDGVLELYMPSLEHELIKKIIARLLERYAEEQDIPLHGCGSTTFRDQATARGLEPDECYCIGTLKERPDFAVEVNLTHGGVNKLDVYRGLEVPEVLIWDNHQLKLYDLRGDFASQVAAAEHPHVFHSLFFPGLDFRQLAKYVQPYNQPEAIKGFMQAIRKI